MRRLLLCLGCSLASFGLVAACSKSSSNSNPDGGTSQQPDGGMPQPDGGMPQPDGGTPQPDGGMPQPDGGTPDGGTPDGGMPDGGGMACDPDASTSNYVLIDDMETTMNGPIQFMTGIADPLTPGYWYNSGAAYTGDDGGVADMSDPPQMSFTFTALPAATMTLGCTKASSHAAHQSCTLNGLYDTCGIGFEFAQKPDPSAEPDGGDPDSGTAMDPDAGTGDAGSDDAGTSDAGSDDAGTTGDAGPSDAGPSDAGTMSDAGMDDAGDAGPPIPRVTIPFDISHYKAVTFWGKTTTPDPMTGTLAVKMSFPDTDTDPRGDVCNGGGANTSKCYNSYAATFGFTTTWQQFTVNLDAGDGGAAPAGGIAIDPTWGYQGAQWLPTQVYGINWQAQRNIGPTDGPPLSVDFWIDDVFFVQ